MPLPEQPLLMQTANNLNTNNPKHLHIHYHYHILHLLQMTEIVAYYCLAALVVDPDLDWVWVWVLVDYMYTNSYK